MRTYSRSAWEAAAAAWGDGSYGPEWDRWRDLARRQGIAFPPNGSSVDPWDDDRPSQRAVVARAIAETPRLLERAIHGARGWSQVVERLLLARDRWRERQRDDREHVDRGPDRAEAADILARIGAEIGGAR